MPRTARRPELSDDLLREIRAWAAAGIPLGSIASKLGIAPRTLDRWRKEEEDVEAAYKAGLADEEEGLVGNLRRLAAEGNAAANMFLLKTKHGYRETQKIEHAGEGAPQVELGGGRPELVEDSA